MLVCLLYPMPNLPLIYYLFIYGCLHPVHPLGYIRIEAKFGVVRFHSSPKGVAGIRTQVCPTKASLHHHWANTYLVPLIYYAYLFLYFLTPLLSKLYKTASPTLRLLCLQFID